MGKDRERLEQAAKEWDEKARQIEAQAAALKPEA
jgi:hypothetical protein